MLTHERRRAIHLSTIAALGLAVAACAESHPPSTSADRRRFTADLTFLRQHTDIVLLTDPSGARVAIAPGYQGRVMTSTTGGEDDPSFGWLGRDAIASGQRQPHMNVFGGEDRFWLGPEGGQYALYFTHGDPFDLEHWQVPEPIDWGAWSVVDRTPSAVQFSKRMTVRNYASTTFELNVQRTVRLLGSSDILPHAGEAARDVRSVAFESVNTVTNAGRERWRPESGLISIWILGMFNPSPRTTVAIPFAPGEPATLGPIVNDAYFGKVPPDRLVVKDSVILFRGDGQYRSKIGLSPSRALSVAGSYDADNRVLTIVEYTRPPHADRYVNSMWEMQGDPYEGDVINSYNDGPAAPGKPPLGPFYELETSSPALILGPGERYTHHHRTFHFVGPEPALDRIAQRTLRIGIRDLTNAFAAAASR